MGNAMPPNADDTARTEVQRLFIEHLDRIRGYVRAILPDPDLAGDVVQEVFLAVSARAADYDATRSFEAWAFGFARNKVLEVGRPQGPAAGPASRCRRARRADGLGPRSGVVGRGTAATR